MNGRNKLLLVIFSVLFFCLAPFSAALAEEGTVYDQYKGKSEQTNTPSKEQVKPPTTSVMPYIFQFIGSFLLIVGVLYVVLRFVSRKAKAFNRGGPFHAIGAHPFGNNRSVQLLMIGDTLYVLGVSENVNLLRCIPPGEEQQQLLQSMADTPITTVVPKWGFRKKKATTGEWDDILRNELHELQSHSELKQE